LVQAKVLREVSGLPLVVVGCLSACWRAWQVIGASQQVLVWIQWGLSLVLLGDPVEDPQQFQFTADQWTWLMAELVRLVGIQAVKHVGHGPI
jgi:hypothetical protein